MIYFKVPAHSQNKKPISLLYNDMPRYQWLIIHLSKEFEIKNISFKNDNPNAIVREAMSVFDLEISGYWRLWFLDQNINIIL